MVVHRPLRLRTRKESIMDEDDSGLSKRTYSSIPSYGIILCYVGNNGLEFLIQQRRDTYEYVDICRGSWTDKQIFAMFCMLTPEERDRLASHTLDEIWSDLWIDPNSKMYKDGYPKAKRKWELLKERLPKLLSSTKSCVSEAPWTFPKGKRAPRESHLTCALREFEEETRIPSSLIDVLPCAPLEEHFVGSNGRNYSTHYYLATVKKKMPIEYISTSHLIRKQTVSEEAYDARWITSGEADKYLNEERASLLRIAETMINEIISQK
jgi:8-oxo-dGTP pyrophosphatase MutT (NUDIX family)